MKSFYYYRGRAGRRGFTLVELLVAIGILGIILVMLASVVAGAASVWKRINSRISTFEESRAAFESMTRKISQATLNTYYDYVDANGKSYDPTGNPNFVPASYARQSDLHFVSGLAKTLFPGKKPLTTGSVNSAFVTHAIFFQAPLGYTQANVVSQKLGKLLNVSGFFVEYDANGSVPNFYKTAFPAILQTSSARYRLMEIWQPTENMEEYQNYTNYLANPTPATAISFLRTWYWNAATVQSCARPLAQNIIALIILPRRSVGDPNTGLLTYNNTYTYDTRKWAGLSTPNASANLERNQLPPVVQVTMVAIDEPSAVRMQTLATSQTKNLLNNATFVSTPGTDSTYATYTSDMTALTTAMVADKLNYRIYSTNVPIRQAKWF